jgi:hypothetical protein
VGPISSIDNSIFHFKHDIDIVNTDALDGGWLEERNGVKILHVGGTNYEMGYQHGYLLKEEIQENIRGFLNLYEQHDVPYEFVIKVWSIQQHYLPEAYKQEIQGMADGADLSYSEVALHNTWVGVFNYLYLCWGAALWGDATVDGHLLHMRGVDGVNSIQDQVTKTYVYENQVIIVRHPNQAYASIAPIFAGDIVCIGGFNDQGVGVSELSIIADTDTTFHGINAGYRMRMVLDYATDGFEAVDIMNSNRTCHWNFIVSDGSLPMGFAIEQSVNFAYAYAWFDTVESTDPFWAIKDVVRRGNCYISPTMADMEREVYDPSGIWGLIRLLFFKDPSFGTWAQYKAISIEIEEQYGTLTTESALTILREVYSGNTGFLSWFLSTGDDTARQWVGCPVTGEFAICFAENGMQAYENRVHTFNFYELLDADPPP